MRRQVPSWLFKDGKANPIVCGRKFCALCGRWRPVTDFNRDRANTLTGLRSYCHACDRTRRREWWHNATVAQRQRVVEYRRFWREAHGATPRSRPHTVIDRTERVFLPLAPLIVELERYDDGELSNLAARAGISTRALYRYRYGESASVRIDVADKLAVAMGKTSSLVWAEQW